MQRRWRWILPTFLAVLLVGSNVFWLYVMLDQATIKKYDDIEIYSRGRALGDCLAVVPALAHTLDKGEVVRRFSAALEDDDPFEKDGFTSVGSLNLRFGAEGRLQAVETKFGFATEADAGAASSGP